MPAAPQIGNDVVDLGDPEIAEHHRRKRFVDRVCGGPERAMLSCAPDPRELLWRLFAAKEAAFKVVAKLGPPPPFAHRRFEVADDARCVRYGALELPLLIERHGDAIHAVAWLGAPPALAEVMALRPGDDPGAAVRGQLCRALATRLGCAADALRVVRDPMPGGWTGAAPPRLERDGAPVAIDLSLSHDGRFGAYAATAPG